MIAQAEVRTGLRSVARTVADEDVIPTPEAHAEKLKHVLTPILFVCLSRIKSWHTPPNWRPEDWLDELRSVCWAVACQSAQAYEVMGHVPFGAFIYQRAISAARTRFRQEWTYCFHSFWSTGENLENVLPNLDLLQKHYEGQADDSPLWCCLNEAVNSLTPSQRSLIQGMYWSGYSTAELAQITGIGERGMRKRKRAALSCLRAILKSKYFRGGGYSSGLRRDTATEAVNSRPVENRGVSA